MKRFSFVPLFLCAAVLSACGGSDSSLAPANISVTGVTLKDSTTVEIGSWEDLSAAIEPSDATNKNVSWSSSAGGVATVSQTGRVTGIRTGDAVITVTTEDGTFSDTCAVHVAEVTAQGVSISPASLSLGISSGAQLTAVFNPTDTTNRKVTWSSANEAIAAVSSTGYVTAKTTTGSTTITVTAEDGGHTAECTVTVTSDQIIADHTVVDRYDDIPAEYIDAVKKMWINIPGESHSQAYRTGLGLLAELDSRFATNATTASNTDHQPAEASASYLRTSRYRYINDSYFSDSTGESSWYTNADGIDNIKAHLDFFNAGSGNNPIAAMGFGWCWDMTWTNVPGGTLDPVYKVHWAGSSDGGPQDNLIWGLDAGDEALTGNSVCMDTYLSATQQYADYCKAQGYITKVMFTTGPVDSYEGENGVQREIKHEYIRSYVKADSSRILFDYADILSWNDAGEENTATWTDSTGAVRTYHMIHPDNLGDETVGHIGNAGALRLGKAQWWILARIAGWDGK